MSRMRSASSLTGYGDEYAASRAYVAFAISPLRVELIRYLLVRDEVSVGELMREFCVTRNGIVSHLRALTVQGLAHERRATHPRGSGPITYWSIDRFNVDELLATLTAHLLGTTDGG